jgi:hypothetical protein
MSLRKESTLRGISLDIAKRNIFRYSDIGLIFLQQMELHFVSLATDGAAETRKF